MKRYPSTEEEYWSARFAEDCRQAEFTRDLVETEIVTLFAKLDEYINTLISKREE